MPRTAREHNEGSILHLVTRGVNRQCIFISDLERNVFVGWMREAFLRHGANILSYCLMPNHVHILVAVGAVPIGRAMHDLLTRYSLLFNARYERVGHLFENRFKERPVTDIKYLINASAYIHLNPVRAALVRKPEDWGWSGHNELLRGGGSCVDLSRLLELTGLSVCQLQESYRDRINEHMGTMDVSGLTLREIIMRASMSFGLEPAAAYEQKKGGIFTRARKRAVKWARSRGFTLAEIAEELGCSIAAVANLATENST